MTNESIRDHCLALPHTAEVVRWGSHLLFKVAGKLFAMIDLDGHSCGFRCMPEVYAELVEMPDIVPASHNMWKYQWVTTETLSALPDRQFREYLTASYDIVRGTLPARVKAALAAGSELPPAPARAKRRRSTPASGRAKRR
jgi:predicted DNA-binding protein (MmcQ/YjbR family)